ncbi:hypothetical protein [Mesorhizobium sp. NZP2077]|uniref:hypothetical protein n=1 Tax=Mesorhizobium sp. NZP2077 TaxID=2483404 RepID=UPI001FEE5E08|nr:hypothetical protein [Mesorhizobium sp. NZP2077]
MVTFTHVEMGEAVFGIATGSCGSLGDVAHPARRVHGKLCATPEALVNKIAGEPPHCPRWESLG